MMNTGGRMGGAITAALFLQGVHRRPAVDPSRHRRHGVGRREQAVHAEGPDRRGSANAGGAGVHVAHVERRLAPPDPPPAHVRRRRYAGKNPRAFHDKYKELNPEQYPADVQKVLASGRTPAGMHRPDHGARSAAAAFGRRRRGRRGLHARRGRPRASHPRTHAAGRSRSSASMSIRSSCRARKRACARPASEPTCSSRGTRTSRACRRCSRPKG